MKRTAFSPFKEIRMPNLSEDITEIKNENTTSQSSRQRSARKSLSLKKIRASKNVKEERNYESKCENKTLCVINEKLNDSCFDESDFQAIDELMSTRNKTVKKHESPKKNTKKSNESLNPMKKVRKCIDDSGMESMLETSQLKVEDTSQITSDVKSVLLGNAQAPLSAISKKTRSMLDESCVSILNDSVNLDDLDSSIIRTNDASFYGLPASIKQLVRDFKGIDDLYLWQKECLNLDAIRDKKNLIYSLPTSGGKTLVAEILILREILCNKRNAIFIFPYVSIVQEKVRSLSPFALALNFLVEEYAGSKGQYPPRKRRWKNVVYVATIEKALGLVNSLVETDRLSELGLVVVDELHMLGDGSRGATLECLLTRLLYTKLPIQIIGMSATIGNLEDLSHFLHAETYTQDFRPVELKEYVKLGNKIFLIDQSSEQIFLPDRSLPAPTAEEKKKDPDQLGKLVREVVPNNSCLVFCATKKNCENVAILLISAMDKEVKQHKIEEKVSLYRALLVEGNGKICSTLRKTIPYGIAYHHSGLTMNERNLLEEGYRAGILCCLCCTSTLAAGVNLPAKRVILREPKIAAEFLTLSVYKQMVGRAGRAGHDSIGESILICLQNEVPKVRALLTSGMNQCRSQIYTSRGNCILEQLIVSSVGLQQTNTPGEIKKMFQGSLLSVQAEKLALDVPQLVDDIIYQLFQSQVLAVMPPPKCTSPSKDVTKETPHIPVITDSTKLCISTLGKAAMKGNMSIEVAQELQTDLREAQKALNLLTPLHLLYLVIPKDSYCNLKYPTSIFANAYLNLSTDDKHTLRLFGVTEGMAVNMMTGAIPRSVTVMRLRRIFGALMLRQAWETANIWDVAHKFEQPRGTVQQIMTSSSAFASNVQNFCLELHEEFWCFNALLSQLSERLAHCCAVELLPLMELPAVKKGRARQLYDAGYKTLHDVSVANPRELTEKIINMPHKVARHMISTAKMLLVERAETLREAAEELLEGSRHDIPPILPMSPSQSILSPTQSRWRSPKLQVISRVNSPPKPNWPSKTPST